MHRPVVERAAASHVMDGRIAARMLDDPDAAPDLRPGAVGIIADYMGLYREDCL